jgi:hypothetical protein
MDLMILYCAEQWTLIGNGLVYFLEATPSPYVYTFPVLAAAPRESLPAYSPKPFPVSMSAITQVDWCPYSYYFVRFLSCLVGNEKSCQQVVDIICLHNQSDVCDKADKNKCDCFDIS